MQEVEEVQKSVPVITYERHLSAKRVANRVTSKPSRTGVSTIHA